MSAGSIPWTARHGIGCSPEAGAAPDAGRGGDLWIDGLLEILEESGREEQADGHAAHSLVGQYEEAALSVVAEALRADPLKGIGAANADEVWSPWTRARCWC